MFRQLSSLSLDWTQLGFLVGQYKQGREKWEKQKERK